jgi:hypothetical protein
MWLIQSAATENSLLYFAREYSKQPTAAVRQHTGAGSTCRRVSFLAWVRVDDNFSVFNPDSARGCWKKFRLFF